MGLNIWNKLKFRVRKYLRIIGISMEKNKIFTYDDMYNGALSLKQKLLDLSLSLPEDCDFIRGIKDSEFILKRFKEGNYPDFNSEEQKKYAHMCALFNFNTWIERVGGIETIKKYNLVEHLRLFVAAKSISPIYPTSDDMSRKLTELIVALNLLRFADNVIIDDGKSPTRIPDIRFEINGSRFAIECKTIETMNDEGIWKNVKTASEQINEINDPKLILGAPLLSMRNDKYYEGLFSKTIFESFHDALSKFSGELKRALHPVQNENRFIDDMKSWKHDKTIHGFLLFENFIARAKPYEKTATEIKAVELIRLDEDIPEIFPKIVTDLNMHLQMQNYGQFFPNNERAKN